MSSMAERWTRQNLLVYGPALPERHEKGTQLIAQNVKLYHTKKSSYIMKTDDLSTELVSHTTTFGKLKKARSCIQCISQNLPNSVVKIFREISPILQSIPPQSQLVELEKHCWES